MVLEFLNDLKSKVSKEEFNIIFCYDKRRHKV